MVFLLCEPKVGFDRIICGLVVAVLGMSDFATLSKNVDPTGEGEEEEEEKH